MNPFQLLFSFKGRIGRAAFAGGTLLAYALVIGVIFLAAYLSGAMETPRQRPPESLVQLMPFLVLLLAWAQLALAAKRYHDLGKSGWFSLLLVIPLVGLIVFIYLLAARSEERDNDYGSAQTITS